MSVGNVSYNSPSAISLQVQQPQAQSSDADGDPAGVKNVKPAAPPPPAPPPPAPPPPAPPPANRGRSVDVTT